MRYMTCSEFIDPIVASNGAIVATERLSEVGAPHRDHVGGAEARGVSAFRVKAVPETHPQML